MPKLLLPTRVYRLAEQQPDDFEKVIVKRARLSGPKLNPVWPTRSARTSFTGTADTPPAMDVGCLADMLFLFVVGRARNLGSRFEGFVEVATFHVEVRQDTLEPSG